MIKYNYHSNFIFRTPRLALQKSLSTIELFEFSQQDFFKEAIYIASPILYDELIKWHNNELSEQKEIDKLIVSLYKYYARMQSRCTPYGLFAACGSGGWDKENKLMLTDKRIRHTRLDMNYLCSLAQYLNTHPALLHRLRFYPNNSTYIVGENMRYVEYTYSNNRRMHQITSVNFSVYLESVLQKAVNGAGIKELAFTLLSDEITEEDAESFIQELIESQLLVSELEPAVTGDEFIYQLIHSLKSLNDEQHPDIENIITLLEETQRQIDAMDIKEINDPIAYRSIYKQLKTLGSPIEENQLFQVDLYNNTNVATLDTTIQRQLLGAITFLDKFSPANENTNLKTFKENFYKQYENAEMPLLQVLDTETGVGYTGKDTTGVNKLLDDLYIPGKASFSYDIKWNKQQEILQKHLLKASTEKLYTVEFTDDDLKGMEANQAELPDSLSVMFRFVNKENIYLQSCGGSSAANLIGRFAHGDSKIHSIIRDIATYEQNINKDKILAEIVHLPESRIGNILLRPVLRAYEIPYLGKSALPSENQIMLQDLYVSVQHDRILLRSKKLNKEIIPRLSTAHNYSFNALPVYQFLCDLQTQYFQKVGVGFTWGALSSSYKFLPRATYKNVILERAKWNLLKDDIKVLLKKNDVDYFINITTWRNELMIPSKVWLVDGDNELLINFEDELSISMLVASIKNRDQITLEEFLFDSNELIVQDKNENGYVNECIAILLKEKETSMPTAEFHTIHSTQSPASTFNIQRAYSIGSEWLYYKLYVGVKTSDKLLAEVILPLTEKLKEEKLIDRFFFIRYADPEHHLRLRFHLSDINKLGLLINEVYQTIQPFLDQGLISKVQTDTYNRELERYGSNSMELAEAFFFIDSAVTLQLLSLIDGDEGEVLRWQFVVRSIDDLLADLNFDVTERLKFMETLKSAFFKEHGDSKALKLQLDVKFRTERKHVEDVLDRTTDATKDIQPLLELLEWKRQHLKPIIEKLLALRDSNQLQVPLQEIVESYIHMLVNRTFMARQRTYEMVVYDLLYRYYKSLAGREKSKNKSQAAIEQGLPIA